MYNVQLLDTALASRNANVTGAPAPADIAVQMYQRGTHPTIFAKLLTGQSIPQVIAWAKDEVDGFMR